MLQAGLPHLDAPQVRAWGLEHCDQIQAAVSLVRPLLCQLCCCCSPKHAGWLQADAATSSRLLCAWWLCHAAHMLPHYLSTCRQEAQKRAVPCFSPAPHSVGGDLCTLQQ